MKLLVKPLKNTKMKNSKEEIFDRVTDILFRDYDLDGFSNDLELYDDLGLDYLEALEFIGSCELEFGVTINKELLSDEDITLGELVDLIYHLSRSKPKGKRLSAYYGVIIPLLSFLLGYLLSLLF